MPNVANWGAHSRYMRSNNALVFSY
jgi:hypothetical protein